MSARNIGGDLGYCEPKPHSLVAGCFIKLNEETGEETAVLFPFAEWLKMVGPGYWPEGDPYPTEEELQYNLEWMRNKLSLNPKEMPQEPRF